MERIQKLRQLLEVSPDDPFLQHALGLEYVKQGDDAQAETVFKQLLAKDGSYIGSYYHLAKVEERLGKKEEARRWYEQGMRIAKEANDQHAFNELQAACEDL
jgi:Tfp pilus assembly protein PilF